MFAGFLLSDRKTHIVFGAPDQTKQAICPLQMSYFPKYNHSIVGA